MHVYILFLHAHEHCLVVAVRVGGSGARIARTSIWVIGSGRTPWTWGWTRHAARCAASHRKLYFL